jgi:hypothetical protein
VDDYDEKISIVDAAMKNTGQTFKIIRKRANYGSL